MIRDKSLGDSNETTMIPFSFERERSKRDAGFGAFMYPEECSGRILSLADWEQRIPKSPKRNAKEQHTVNRYVQEEAEERERERTTRDCVIPSNQEGGGS